MKHAQPLPDYLVKNYQNWKTSTVDGNEERFTRLAKDPQRPTSMIISCCDSRVNVTSIFGADPGDMFVHRNIANLVPAHSATETNVGTTAALQYAIGVLKVSHLIVMGHSGCGGVEGCYEMCSGEAPELNADDSYVGRWIGNLRPAFDKLPHGDDASRKTAFEKIAVALSLENLMTFQFVAKAVEDGDLTLHGLWHNIGTGKLEILAPDSTTFHPL